MARPQLMTWREDSKRWVKTHNKKEYVVSCRQLGAPRTKEGSRQAANEWWEGKLIELEGQPPPEADGLLTLPAMSDILDGKKSLPADGARIDLEEWLPHLNGKPFPEGFAPKFRERAEALLNSLSDVADDTSFAGTISAFCQRKQAFVETNARSVGWFAAITSHLKIFAEWAGKNRPVSAISATLLEDFHTYLLSRSDLSADYKRDIIGTAKQYIRWLWKRGLCDLPRNIDDRDLSFKKSIHAIKTFDVAELMNLVNAANDRLKLCMLLMANCGMQQTDISDLRQDEVDWQVGRIRRRRSKTAKHDDVPVADYKLWPETFALLKQQRSDDPVRVLLNENGKPLKQTGLTDKGHTNNDNIKSAYMRLLRDQLKIPEAQRKPLKLIRKTSASLLERHRDFGRYAQYFLGHSPRTIAEKHYVQPSIDNFDEALSWLREHYGLGKKPPKAR
jgi:integrase